MLTIIWKVKTIWKGSKKCLPFPIQGTVVYLNKRDVTQQPRNPHLLPPLMGAQFFKKIIYFWLCCVFVSVRGLSLVVASGGHSSSQCVGLSLPRPLSLRSMGSRRAGSLVVAHGPSCSAACGIFPDQGRSEERRVGKECRSRWSP